ncbi:hypothetical protein PHYSODRAFT_486372 [Phytophthora sojae]|uniref:Transmembrane protein n=1 Tax=Phytophthora sojae (strain P6497) TaxID=1094619 RepID=G4YY70_PHYSP|nr:hypothetical protein PHYSODRAFT_486372 [Phytophthora sojae]EGZ26238.1 hypothetical protein PHYSODRAFT_486372 [Phytophthora sojae]|eukprot:XP_009521526.1 hypothetical protein PHYSODRAFT_486372 [Phytophthora sojae]
MVSKPGPGIGDKPKVTHDTPFKRGLRHVHRLLVFGTAMWYVVISLMATDASLVILKDQAHYDSGIIPLVSPLIAGYAGTSSIRESPLVMETLKDSTKPFESGTLFLVSSSSTSFEQCAKVVNSDAVNVYKDSFLRWIYDDLQEKTAYNISLFNEVELVLPVVDCDFAAIDGGGAAVARVYYLVRYKTDTDRMLLLPTSMSIQDYYIAEQYERGSALLLAFSVVEDMQSTLVDHHFAIALDYPYEYKPDFEVCNFFDHMDTGFWSLETIPRDSFLRPPKPILSARQLGFYLDKETSQVNQINFHWDPPDDAYSALTDWNWHGDAIIRDNWAWVHIIHLLFALDVLFQLSLLLFLVFRSLRQGRLWIGDAFASISNALLYRGIYVVISNHVNGYWTLTEFSLALANSIGGNSTVKYRSDMAHADMLTIYLNLVSILSYVLRERVDPIFVMVCFEIGFYSRESMATILPALQKLIVDYSNTESAYGQVEVDDFLANLSPMRLWTVHPIQQSVWPLLVATFIIIYLTLIVIVGYMIVRKLIQCHSSGFQVGDPDSDSKSTTPRRQSSGLFRKKSQPRELMQFETATGSVLKNRFGVLASYDNYTMINGQRFASGDAIYCNGFVVANDKFVVATEDLMSLIIMKLTRARFTNIYVYTIKDGTGVNQTARLVYPSTISWHDLAKVSVSPLS